MSVVYSLFSFVIINSCSQVVFSQLPDCNNETEVKNFMSSPLYLSLYSLNANATKAKLNATQKALQNQDLSLRLEEILPQNVSTYMKRRPPTFCDHPTNVVFHLTLLSLDTINESDMTFILDFWISIVWYDTRLRFPTSSSRDVRSLDIRWLDEIWKPDVIIRNAREIDVHDQIVPNSAMKMLKDRVVVLYAKVTTVLTCVMSFEKYPHDVQVCDMKMESMTNTQDDLTFSWDVENPLTIYEENDTLKTPQFKIPKNSIKMDNCSEPAYYSGSYSCIRIQFHFERSLGYHMIHTYIPSSCVVVLSWITFWMKAEALAARFGLGVTALLTLVTLNSQSQTNLPPESYAKAVDIWMMSCALFVFGTILEFAIVNYLVCRFTENPVENIVKSQELMERLFHRIRTVFTNERIHTFCRYLDRVSRASFPLCFVILNFWYWNKYVFSRKIPQSVG